MTRPFARALGVTLVASLLTVAGGCSGDDDPMQPGHHGFRPATLSDAHADAAYAAWKTAFLEDCGGGVQRVRWSQPALTVSEGIGYGMLLAVAHDERPVFDGLWQYYKNNVDELGLMHWQRSGCEGATAGNYAASDADLDAAMALLMAARRWSTTPYQADAEMLIRAIGSLETSTAPDGLTVLNPGDSFGGYNCLNFSYFAPAYYRAFARAVPDMAAMWTKLADDTYVLLDRVAHPATGLVPNWCDDQGATTPAGPAGCGYYTNADVYGADAARTPWRIATDYVWWGTPAAAAYAKQVTAWVKTVGIANVVNSYQLDGTPTGTAHSVVVLGAFATAAMAFDQATADEFGGEVAALPQPTGYFSSTLRALYLLLPTGRFLPPAP